MPTRDRLNALEERRAQLDAKIQLLKQRESEAERKRDTRRKILIGAAVMARLKRGEWQQAQLVELLDRELKANRDRELFGLSLRDETAAPSSPSPASGDTAKADGGNRP